MKAEVRTQEQAFLITATMIIALAVTISAFIRTENLQWYCYYPETLTVGTYDKTFYIGDKTVYVTIKVIAAPTNNGTTTVVF